MPITPEQAKQILNNLYTDSQSKEPETQPNSFWSNIGEGLLGGLKSIGSGIVQGVANIPADILETASGLGRAISDVTGNYPINAEHLRQRLPYPEQQIPQYKAIETPLGKIRKLEVPEQQKPAREILDKIRDSLSGGADLLAKTSEMWKENIKKYLYQPHNTIESFLHSIGGGASILLDPEIWLMKYPLVFGLVSFAKGYKSDDLSQALQNGVEGSIIATAFKKLPEDTQRLLTNKVKELINKGFSREDAFAQATKTLPSVKRQLTTAVKLATIQVVPQVTNIVKKALSGEKLNSQDIDKLIQNGAFGVLWGYLATRSDNLDQLATDLNLLGGNLSPKSRKILTQFKSTLPLVYKDKDVKPFVDATIKPQGPTQQVETEENKQPTKNKIEETKQPTENKIIKQPGEIKKTEQQVNKVKPLSELIKRPADLPKYFILEEGGNAREMYTYIKPIENANPFKVRDINLFAYKTMEDDKPVWKVADGYTGLEIVENAKTLQNAKQQATQFVENNYNKVRNGIIKASQMIPNIWKYNDDTIRLVEQLNKETEEGIKRMMAERKKKTQTKKTEEVKPYSEKTMEEKMNELENMPEPSAEELKKLEQELNKQEQVQPVSNKTQETAVKIDKGLNKENIPKPTNNVEKDVTPEFEWVELKRLPEKGEYIKVSYKGKTYEGEVTNVGEKYPKAKKPDALGLSMRSGYVAGVLRTPDGKLITYPRTSTLKFLKRIERPIEKTKNEPVYNKFNIVKPIGDTNKKQTIKTIEPPSVSELPKKAWEMTKEEWLENQIPISKEGKRPISFNLVFQKLQEQVGGEVISTKSGEHLVQDILSLSKRWNSKKAQKVYMKWQNALKRGGKVFKAHHYYIEQAIKEGKDVPKEILEIYPDLIEKYKLNKKEKQITQPSQNAIQRPTQAKTIEKEIILNLPIEKQLQKVFTTTEENKEQVENLITDLGKQIRKIREENPEPLSGKMALIDLLREKDIWGKLPLKTADELVNNTIEIMYNLSKLPKIQHQASLTEISKILKKYRKAIENIDNIDDIQKLKTELDNAGEIIQGTPLDSQFLKNIHKLYVETHKELESKLKEILLPQKEEYKEEIKQTLKKKKITEDDLGKLKQYYNNWFLIMDYNKKEDGVLLFELSQKIAKLQGKKDGKFASKLANNLDRPLGIVAEETREIQRITERLKNTSQIMTGFITDVIKEKREISRGTELRNILRAIIYTPRGLASKYKLFNKMYRTASFITEDNRKILYEILNELKKYEKIKDSHKFNPLKIASEILVLMDRRQTQYDRGEGKEPIDFKEFMKLDKLHITREEAEWMRKFNGVHMLDKIWTPTKDGFDVKLEEIHKTALKSLRDSMNKIWVEMISEIKKQLQKKKGKLEELQEKLSETENKSRVAKKIDKIQEEIKDLEEYTKKRKWYFPHVRNKRYVVITKQLNEEGKPDVVDIASFDYLRDAQDYANRQPNGYIVEVKQNGVINASDVNEITQIGALSLSKIIEKVGKAKGLSKEDLHDFVKDSIKELETQSMLRVLRQRKGISGWDISNPMSIIYQYLTGGASSIAKTRHIKDLIDSYAEFRNDVKDHTLISYAKQYLRNQIRRTTQWDKIAGYVQEGLFLHFLGFRPMQFIINATQNITNGIPILSRVFGINEAGAMKELTKSLIDLTRGHLTKDEIELLQKAEEVGDIKSTYVREWIGSQGTIPSAYKKGLDMMGFFMEKSEELNRKLMLITAYRLSKKFNKIPLVNDILLKRGEELGFNKYQQHAREITRLVHYDYGRHNIHPFIASGTFSGNIGRMLITFQTFTWHYLNMMLEIGNSFGNRDALRTLLASSIAIGMLGGIKATPVFGILNWLYGRKGSPLDKWFAKEYGGVEKFFADLIKYGVIGLTDIDVAPSLAIQLPISLQDTALVSLWNRLDYVFANNDKLTLNEILRSITPIRALRDLLNAVEWYKKGITNKAGTPIIVTSKNGLTPVKATPLDMIVKIIGGYPKNISQNLFVHRLAQGIKSYFDRQVYMIKKSLRNMILSNDIDKKEWNALIKRYYQMKEMASNIGINYEGLYTKDGKFRFRAIQQIKSIQNIERKLKKGG